MERYTVVEEYRAVEDSWLPPTPLSPALLHQEEQEHEGMEIIQH